MNRRRLTALAIGSTVCVWLMIGVSAATAASVSRVSVSSAEKQANGASRPVAVSPDGRFVLFNSAASNLVSGDTNRVEDVFLRDRVEGRTFRVSVGRDARQANGRSWGYAVSADGRFVLFMSTATNLTREGDTNAEADVFLKDRRTGSTYRVSVPRAGGQFHDGKYGGLVAGGLSDDGRYVAFGEYVPVRPTGCCAGMLAFVRDRVTHTTHLVAGSAGQGGSGAIPVGLSASGQYVLIQLIDDHQNPAGLVLQNRFKPHHITVSMPGEIDSFNPPVMTSDAHYVVFAVLNAAQTGWDVERWNRVTRVTKPVIENRASDNTPLGVSLDGQYVAFSSDDPALVAGDTNGAADVFRRDLTTNAVVRLDLTSTGAQIPKGVAALRGPSPFGPLLTAHGATIVFGSSDGAVVPGDTNGVQDVFIRTTP